MDTFTLPLSWEEDHLRWHMKASAQEEMHCWFPCHVFSTELDKGRKLLSTLVSLHEWLFSLWRRRHALSFPGTWRMLGILPRPCRSPTRSSHWQTQISVLCINSPKAFTLAGGHISWPENGSIPVLSRPPELVSMVYALPNPSAWSPTTRPPIPCWAGSQIPFILPTLLVQDQQSKGWLYLYLQPSSQAL